MQPPHWRDWRSDLIATYLTTLVAARIVVPVLQHGSRQGERVTRLPIRRFMVRAQIGEPMNTKVSRFAAADFFVFWGWLVSVWCQF